MSLEEGVNDINRSQMELTRASFKAIMDFCKQALEMGNLLIGSVPAEMSSILLVGGRGLGGGGEGRGGGWRLEGWGLEDGVWGWSWPGG